MSESLPPTENQGTEPPVQHFSPFSIRIGDIKNLGGDDPHYARFRDHVSIVAGLANEYPIHHKQVRLRSGKAINRLLCMALDIVPPAYSSAREDAAKKGVDVHPGKGITLARPEQLEASADEEPTKGEYFHPTPVLLEYARKLTLGSSTP